MSQNVCLNELENKLSIECKDRIGKSKILKNELCNFSLNEPAILQSKNEERNSDCENSQNWPMKNFSSLIIKKSATPKSDPKSKPVKNEIRREGELSPSPSNEMSKDESEDSKTKTGKRRNNKGKIAKRKISKTKKNLRTRYTIKLRARDKLKRRNIFDDSIYDEYDSLSDSSSSNIIEKNSENSVSTDSPPHNDMTNSPQIPKTKRKKNSFVKWSLEEEITLRDCVLYQSQESKTIAWKSVMDMMPQRYQNRTPKKLRNKWRKLLFRKDFVSEADLKRLYRGKKDTALTKKDENALQIPEKPVTLREKILARKNGQLLPNEENADFGTNKNWDKTFIVKKLDKTTIERQNKNFDYNDAIAEKWLKSLEKRIEKTKSDKIKSLDDLCSSADFQVAKNLPVAPPKICGKEKPKPPISQSPAKFPVQKSEPPPLVWAIERYRKTGRSAQHNLVSLKTPAGPKRTSYSMPNYCRLFSPYRFGSLCSKRVPRLEFNTHHSYDRMNTMQLESLFFTYTRNIRIKRFKISECEAMAEKGKKYSKDKSKRYSELKKRLEKEQALANQMERNDEKILWQLQSMQMEFSLLHRKRAQLSD
ncbi:hypothetical protein MHBO_000626 [Bonamia ostreae]